MGLKVGGGHKHTIVDGRLAVGARCTVRYRVGKKHCNTFSSSKSGFLQ